MNPKYFDMAAEATVQTVKDKAGTPFGATVVRFAGTPKEEVVAVSSNTSFRDFDPTAHGEVNAIREACRKLKTNDLSDCVLYATGAPCPMCQAAMVWAKIPTCYYDTGYEELERLGHTAQHVKGFVRGENKVVDMQHTPGHKSCDDLWKL